MSIVYSTINDYLGKAQITEKKEQQKCYASNLTWKDRSCQHEMDLRKLNTKIKIHPDFKLYLFKHRYFQCCTILKRPNKKHQKLLVVKQTLFFFKYDRKWLAFNFCIRELDKISCLLSTTYFNNVVKTHWWMKRLLC